MSIFDNVACIENSRISREKEIAVMETDGDDAPESIVGVTESSVRTYCFFICIHFFTCFHIIIFQFRLVFFVSNVESFYCDGTLITKSFYRDSTLITK